VGGVNQLQSTLYYTFENFVEQVHLAEALTSSDFGVTTGLFNQAFWEMFRFYYVNIERSAITDKNVPRNINISFTNNTQMPIDTLVLIFYSDEFSVDCETGFREKIRFERLSKKHKEKSKCECGVEYTRINKSRHFKTKFHLDFICKQ